MNLRAIFHKSTSFFFHYLLRVENGNVVQHTIPFQTNVHLLKAHPRFRLANQIIHPLSLKLDSHKSRFGNCATVCDGLGRSPVEKQDFDTLAGLTELRLDDAALNRCVLQRFHSENIYRRFGVG